MKNGLLMILPNLMRIRCCVGSWFFVAALGYSIANVDAQTQSGTADVRLDESGFAAELERLAQICDRLNLEPEGRLSRQWMPPRRSDQTVLFVPADKVASKADTGVASVKNVPELSTSADTEARSSWARHFGAARNGFAEHLFDLALLQAESDESQAYRTLWQVLRENPEHARAESILSNMSRALQARPRMVRGRSAIAEWNWSAGTYSLIDTPHFRLITRAEASPSRDLAQQLEEFYVLWSQVFYSLWAAPGTLASRIDGKALSWTQHERIEVVLLQDRQEYLNLLGVAEDNIQVSVGYYNPGARKSFFYPSDQLDVTLYHELTHQLLMEATRIGARTDAGQAAGVWMLEGIALYMESLTKHASYWSVGGWDAIRMQTARYRAVRDGYWPVWRSFSEAGMEAWKSDPEIARFYTHALGLSNLMLDSRGPEARHEYLLSLVGIYQGQNESGGLLQLLGPTEDQAKQAYQEAMIVVDAQLQSLADNKGQPRDLVLCASQLKPATWAALAKFQQLEWLDLSFTNVTDEDLQWLARQTSLRRLSLEGTAITATTVTRISSLIHLQELDLSGCRIDDQALSLLKNNRTIQTLWLTNTQISGDSLPVLASLPSLSQCDIRGTKISSEAWQAFTATRPSLSQ